MQSTAVRTCRLIYYGPAGTGKRDNLLHIANSIPQEHRIAVSGADPEREIAFLLKSGGQGDWRVSVRAVDSGAEGFTDQPGSDAPFDGAVFVAHSCQTHLDQTLSSLEAFKAFLDHWNLDITSMPIVLQYNLRHQEGCLSVDRLESLLNPWGLLSFPANAVAGEGTRETLKAVLSLTLSNLIRTGTAAEVTPADTVSPTPAPTPASMAPDNEPLETAPVAAPITPEAPPVADDFAVTSEDRGGIFFDDLRPPIVVPVRIPGRLLEKYGSARIILEVEVDDGESILV